MTTENKLLAAIAVTMTVGAGYKLKSLPGSQKPTGNLSPFSDDALPGDMPTVQLPQ